MIFNVQTRCFIYFGNFFLLTGTPIFLLAFYLLWYKSSKKTTVEYKFFYSLMILSALVMHLSIFLLLPFLLPPFVLAYTTIGIYANSVFSANFQLCLCYFAGGALFGSDTYLLYWRVFVLLPDTHKLKKKYILYSYYVVLFLLLIFVTILFYVAGRHEHHEAVQRMLKVNGPDFYSNLSDSAIGIFEVSLSNIPLLVLTCALSLTAGLTFFFYPIIVYFAFNLLNQFKSGMSRKTVELHSSMLTAIAAQVTILNCMFTTTVAIIILMYWFNWATIESVNAIFLVGCGLIPIFSILTMILVNKTNRKELLKLLYTGETLMRTDRSLSPCSQLEEMLNQHKNYE